MLQSWDLQLNTDVQVSWGCAISYRKASRPHGGDGWRGPALPRCSRTPFHIEEVMLVVAIALRSRDVFFEAIKSQLCCVAFAFILLPLSGQCFGLPSGISTKGYFVRCKWRKTHPHEAFANANGQHLRARHQAVESLCVFWPSADLRPGPDPAQEYLPVAKYDSE